MEALHLIPEGELKGLKQELSDIKAILEKQPEKEFRLNWIESTRVPSLLGISKKTWQNWRDKRIIPYSQFGAKIYVKISDLNAALESNRITALQ